MLEILIIILSNIFIVENFLNNVLESAKWSVPRRPERPQSKLFFICESEGPEGLQRKFSYICESERSQGTVCLNSKARKTSVFSLGNALL